MLNRHNLMQSATPRYRGKFSCTIVGTGRKYTPVLIPYIAGTRSGQRSFAGNYCWRKLLLDPAVDAIVAVGVGLVDLVRHAHTNTRTHGHTHTQTYTQAHTNNHKYIYTSPGSGTPSGTIAGVPPWSILRGRPTRA